MRTRVVLLLSVLLLAGCGGTEGGGSEESLVQRAYDPRTPADAKRLDAFVRELKPLSAIQIRSFEAFNSGDLSAIRGPADELEAVLAGARKQTVDIEEPRLRDALLEYVVPLEEYSEVVSRFAEAGEEEQSGKPISEAEGEALVAEFTVVAKAVERGERRFEERQRRAATPEEREEFDAAIAAGREKQEDARDAP